MNLRRHSKLQQVTNCSTAHVLPFFFIKCYTLVPSFPNPPAKVLMICLFSVHLSFLPLILCVSLCLHNCCLQGGRVFCPSRANPSLVVTTLLPLGQPETDHHIGQEPAPVPEKNWQEPRHFAGSGRLFIIHSQILTVCLLLFGLLLCAGDFTVNKIDSNLFGGSKCQISESQHILESSKCCGKKVKRRKENGIPGLQCEEGVGVM